MTKREYGSGTIFYNESRKQWVGRYKVGIDSNGKRKFRTVYGKTQKIVKEKLKKVQAEVITGTYTEPSKLTVADIAHSINDNKKALNIVSDTTYHRNKETIKKIIATIPVGKLSEPILTQFLASLTIYSNSLIKKVYATTNAALKKAVNLNLISKNPLDDVVRPNSKKATRKIRALTIDEEKALITALNSERKEPYRTMLLLSLFTGMRMGEICALRPSDLLMGNTIINVSRTMTRDGDYKTVIGKTTKTYAGLRNIKISASIQKLLSDFIENHFVENEYGLLFVAKNGSMICTSQVNLYYKRLIERHNIAPISECNQHQLRHTYATRCIESGMPAKVLQHQLGHTDITTTLNIYCDVFDNYNDTYLDKTQEYFEKQNLAI